MKKFTEHNNRAKANQLAEYITGVELRKYVAEKVKKYAGDNVSVFDGAVGSGQLEQFVNPTHLYGVDIQKDSVNAAKQNYPNSDLQTKSFFLFDENWLADVVIMNPPFSIKFKDLSEEEKLTIQEEFTWKKSGVVDDIFVLKSLKYAKRFGVYILFPGVGYRATEAKFRELIGNQLVELNSIEGAFEDTQINVLFIVVDKQKTDKSLYKEIYNCKAKEVVISENTQIDENFEWRPIYKEEEREEIDINQVNKDIRRISLMRLKKTLETQFFIVDVFKANIDLQGFINEIKAIVASYEERLNTPPHLKN